ncbi:MAG: prolyl oligopeptidase family serine peptidase [Candidatus Acidiferrum sp.]
MLSVVVGARGDEPNYTRARDVIYGRKFGMCLTMDIFTPKQNANGIGLIAVVSGGFFSSTKNINPAVYQPFLKRGYTVFAVVHGSQPKFTVPEIVEDMNRSVRFIRHNAKDYHIDAGMLGIFGGSAGGHLSLMIGNGGKAGDPKAHDPVDRESSRVKAVAAFFPPTDLLNYGLPGKEMLSRSFQPPFTAAVDYKEYDKKKAVYLPVTDEKEQREISKSISPINFVTADSPPTLLMHGDKDELVPMQQSEIMVAKLKAAGVPAELIVKKGEKHGWPTIVLDLETFADWFDKYLAAKKTASK